MTSVTVGAVELGMLGTSDHSMCTWNSMEHTGSSQNSGVVTVSGHGHAHTKQCISTLVVRHSSTAVLLLAARY